MHYVLTDPLLTYIQYIISIVYGGQENDMHRSKSFQSSLYNKSGPLKKKKPGLPVKLGLSSLELWIIIAVITLLLIGGIILLKATSKSAYDIMAKHDLHAFGEYQQFYYKMHKRCLGEMGQSIRNDGMPSDIKADNFSVSEGVCITIVTGSSKHPNNPHNPFIMQAKHEKSTIVFEYNFQKDSLKTR